MWPKHSEWEGERGGGGEARLPGGSAPSFHFKEMRNFQHICV